MKVCIDPGHGGKDKGATGINGILEKKINMNVANYLRDVLKGQGYEVYMTRTDDSYVSIPDRKKYIACIKPDIVVSVHHNAGKGKGHEIIHQINREQSRRFAELLSDEFVKINARRGKGYYSKVHPSNSKLNYFGMLNVGPVAVISEMAFIDSNDVENIDSLREQRDEAVMIYNAIVKLVKELKK